MRNLHTPLRRVVPALLVLGASVFCLTSQAPGGSVVTLAEDGTLVVDGRRTAIYGTFRDPSDDWRRFDGIRSAGFNLTHSYHFSNRYSRIANPKVQEEFIRDAGEYLDRAEQAGVGVFMHLPKHAVEKGQADVIARLVEALKDKPALWLWYLYDEPDVDQLPACRAVYDRIKQVDPDHPVLVVEHREEVMKGVGDCCDVIGVDTYPTPYGLHYFVDLTEKVKKLHPNKPVWSVHGAHCGQTIHLVRRHFKTDAKKTVRRLKINSAMHRPNPKELRALNYLSLTLGSPGSIFYWLPSRYYDIRQDSPAIWEAIQDIGREFRELQPVLNSAGRCEGVRVEPYVVEWRKTEPDIRHWTRTYEGRTYVGLVNAGNDPQVLVTVTLPDMWRRIYAYPDRRLILDADRPRDQQYDPRYSRVLVADWTDKSVTIVMNECDVVVWEVESRRETDY